MMRNRMIRWAAAAGLTASLVMASAAQSHAQTPDASADRAAPAPTACTSTLGATVVYGDVIVPDGQSCRLEGTTVLGRVQVGAGSELITVEARTGAVTLTNSGRLQSTGGVVVGALTSTGTGIVSITDTTVVGRARLNDGSDISLQGITVVGDLVSERAGSLQVRSASVFGSLRAVSAVNFAAVCDSMVSKNAGLRGNETFVQVGGSPECLGNRVAGTVTVANNLTFGTVVGDNVIGRNLDCSGNDPAPTGGNNQVAGAKTGQCATL